MKKLLIWSFIIGIFVISFMPCRVIAQETSISMAAYNAVILFMEGHVSVKQVTIGEWIEATEGMGLYPGDVLRTGSASWAEIGVGRNRKNVIRVQENTLVEFTSLRPVETNLLKGELRGLVDTLSKDETFKIRTPISVCGVRGTGWDTATDGNTANVDVYEGDVYFAAVSPEGEPIDDPIIKAGKSGILKDPAKPVTIKDLPLSKMRAWNKWKQDFRQRMNAAGGVKGKVGEVEQKQKTIQNMLKGKNGTFEQRDRDNVDKRFECNDGVKYP